ncbi:SNF2/Brahma-type chromatin-remodeling protein CHR12 [Perilla frutescens var. hirtella]|uniref:DNA helicase n=1 Tax=Perilla frutescens var. hirtella TaxID=608512 RepID=A0AAD4IUQ1_PERFH|nr:SNF2/Brahma-type chromatin-remodeling protein CHR12 [Perilla frutescens var. hirtella]KAH6816465.1 SNF2/Brahma-type chromatin-remodeling protein CHR12 [Perilla frutescens var. frutescens]KAH6821644.1 SNF2/Brahma-type chromatin-remodeling protein CHR12 [Perilla frutescens var. hirtella]
MVAQVAEPQPSAPQQLGLRQPDPDPEPETAAASAKTLICALNFLSRNLPLPQHVYDAVSSICQDSEADASHELPADEVDRDVDGDVSNGATKDKFGVSTYNELMLDFEDAVSKQRSDCLPSSKLSDIKEARFQSQIKHRLTELEELPTSRGEDLQSRCLLELYGLKLAKLQSKVRSEVSSEYWLRLHCANPDKQLFDWGMMRLRRPFFGIGDAFALETDDPLKKKREAERFSRFEEEEKNRIETRKRKFFADLLNAARELQLQVQASQKRRKQRNDGVQAWHGRLRQRATRAEKLRFQALKAGDQDAYMKMVEESKNERLTTLLGKTNELFVRLGAAVQREKDAAHDSIEPLEVSDPELSAPRTDTPAQSLPEEDEEIDDESDDKVKTGDLLEGERNYDSVIHSIVEKVTEQPCMLQGGELRSYQIEGLQWMVSLFNNNLNGILADEMGLGKTIQTIALIAYLMENKSVTGPHLIVAPKAVLPNWVNEFTTWAPGISAVLYDGRIDERKALREEYSGEGKFNVLITHYDLIIRDKAFLKKIHWHYLVVDEGHRLKNYDCVLARTLVQGYRIRRRLLLTGTPIQNSLQELWSLLNFLLPNIFNSVENFEEWFNAPFADKCDVSLTEEEKFLVIRRLHHVIRPFILRRKKDEVEKFLPSKVQVILKCDLSAWQKVYYQQVTEMGRVGLSHGSGRSKSLQNLTMQLRKCCNHPYLFLGDYFMQRSEDIVRSSGKFELLDRLLPKLHRAGHRVLLFSQMTKLMTILGDYLMLKGYQFLRLDGTTSTGDRGELLKQFNAPDSPYFIFLLSTRAGGLGLNLQTADTVIIFDSDWNPQMDQQAEDRAHRIGQKKEVRVFVLVSVGSVEEVILERAKQKMGIDAKVIQAGLFNTTSTAQDRREMLEDIMRRGTSALGTDVPSEREINRLAARTDEEFWLFEKMDEERRQRENYRTRLMEEHEVPDWVYTVPEINGGKGKGSLDYDVPVTGKRHRKEVIREDTISDSQWSKAVENGDDGSKHPAKRRRENPPVMNNELPRSNVTTDNVAGEKKVVELKSETASMASEAKSEDDNFGWTSQKSKSEAESSQRSGLEALESGLNGLTWKAHKRKRSSLV